jgi:choline dehydrogenase-like flavoprotein
MDCVVGSGPSGVACTAALLKRGRRVHMIDAGLHLEPGRRLAVSDMSKLLPEQWNHDQVRWLAQEASQDEGGIPQKLLFGSDYPYREAEQHLGVSNEAVGLRASLAVGGLSTVWGAAMLPYIERDVADWPIQVQQLSPHYEASVKLTGLSGHCDDLSEMFPLFTQSLGCLEPSQQATTMWRALRRNRTKLRDSGIHCGRARLAIKASRGPQDSGCVSCGMCLYGCPYGFIYNSERTVAQFQADEKFSYQPDVVVAKVKEASNHVIVRGYHRLTREPIEVKAERLYLAAGVLPTTGILLRSMSAYDRTIMMKDSQYFLLPVLLTARVPDVRNERMHTLSQLFLEILDPHVSPYCVHLQVYSFNSFIGRAVRRSLGPLASASEFLTREIEGRLMVIQGYIHSMQSGQIAVTLHGESGRDRLGLAAVRNPETKPVVYKVMRKLLKNALRLGIVPLPMLLKIAQPGRGFHAGGSFPMRKWPTEFESDILGRPTGWKRVHAVDATILPSIAATTITLTVMANAHRIASEVETIG